MTIDNVVNINTQTLDKNEDMEFYFFELDDKRVPKKKGWKLSTNKKINPNWVYFGINIKLDYFVVDLDGYKTGISLEEQRVSINEYVGESLDWEHSLIQITQSGGAHHLFRTEPGVVLTQSNLTRKGCIKGDVDTRRGMGGYIATGKGYNSCVGEGKSLPANLRIASELAPVNPKLYETMLSGGLEEDVETTELNRLLGGRLCCRGNYELLDAVVKAIPSEQWNSYEGWFQIVAAISYETDNSDEGYTILDKYSLLRNTKDDSGKNRYDAYENKTMWKKCRNDKSRLISLRRFYNHYIREMTNKDNGVAVCAELGVDLKQLKKDNTIDELHYSMVASTQCEINKEVLEAITDNTFWTVKNSRFSFLHGSELREYKEHDFLRCVTNKDVLGNIIVFKEEVSKKERDSRFKVIKSIIESHLKNFHYVKEVAYCLDMLAEEDSLSINNQIAYITNKFNFIKNVGYHQQDIEHYKHWFQEIDLFLDFICASRFIEDRKKCYLWLQATSDWGKGLITNKLSELGVSVEITESEIKKAFSGEPSGLNPSKFTHAFCVVIPEFEYTPEQLKQLENSLSITPKGGMKTTVELYSKLFFSAKNMYSLSDNNGIDEELANRFNYIKKEGSIDDDDYFIANKLRYNKSVKGYIAERINHTVRFIRGDVNKAEVIVASFVEKFSIKNKFEVFSKRNIEEVSEAFRLYCLSSDVCIEHSNILWDGEICYLTTKPVEFVKRWIRDKYDNHTVLCKHVGEILDKVSEESRKTYRIKNKSISSYKIIIT